MIDTMNKFLSDHWVMVYGLFIYGLGIITGYFEGKRSRRKD